MFLHGGYTPLQVSGECADHVVAYARRHQGSGLLVVAGRLYASMGIEAGDLPCGTRIWRDTRIAVPFLQEGTLLRDALTNRLCRVEAGGFNVAEAHEIFPVAALVYEADETPEQG